MARVLRPENLKIKRNERAAFVGTTGSGKTTLAKALMWGQRHVIVVDPKRTFTLPRDFYTAPNGDAVPPVTIAGDDKGARPAVTSWKGPGPLIYRPSMKEVQNRDDLDWLFFWVLDRGNTLLYVDEVLLVSDGSSPIDGHAACMQLGRERGVGTWNATQRPVRIPIVCISEAEHAFTFRLRHPDDRQRMADYSDPAVADAEPFKGHPNGFFYYNDPTQTLRFYGRANVGHALTGRG